eukprot:TRINITY_DN19361_c0_g1_i2.p1 TRINITY_DN19361_c0_g1~~TRINITY_DN19361_c0_g1_i2.p1  ORF type:complete len:181 (+),score=28.71 TRINITY_DN19361_c0_g1_i2:58-600(+)
MDRASYLTAPTEREPTKSLSPEAWLASGFSQTWLASGCSQTWSWPSESRKIAYISTIDRAGFAEGGSDTTSQQGVVTPHSSQTLRASPAPNQGYALSSTETTLVQTGERQACSLCGMVHGKACRPSKEQRSTIKQEVLEAFSIQDGNQRLERYRAIALQHGRYACSLVEVFDPQALSQQG